MFAVLVFAVGYNRLVQLGTTIVMTWILGIYLTGQYYSSESMFPNFATAKNREKLDPQTFSSSGAICLKTTKEKCATVKRVRYDWDSSMRPPDY